MRKIRSIAVVATTAALVIVPAATAGASSWGTPQTAFAGMGDADVAMNAAGDVAAVFNPYPDANAVELYERPVGGPATTTVIVSGAVGSIVNPHVALSDTGALAVAWGQSNAVHVAVRPAGSGTFRQPIDVASDITVNADERIAIDDAGEVAMAWTAPSGPVGPYGFTQPKMSWGLIDAAGTLTTAGTVMSPFGAYKYSVAMNRRGDAAVSWWQGQWSPDLSTVQASIRPAGGAFGARTDVSAGTTDVKQDPPTVAVNAQGDVAVGYAQLSGIGSVNNGTAEYVVRVASMPAGGSFGAPEDVSPSGRAVRYPDLALLGDGTTVVTWSAGDGYHVRETAFGAPFTAPDRTFAMTTNGRPATRMAPDGRGALLMFTGDNPSMLMAAMRAADGTYATPVAVGPGSANSMNPTPRGVDASGNVVALYASPTDTVISFSDGTDPGVPLTVRPGTSDGTRTDGGSGESGRSGGPAVTTSQRPAGTAKTPPARTVAVTCRVPSLIGLTTAAAKKKLAAAHCRLGTVTTPKKYKHKHGLVVRAQSRKSGSKATAGTKVGVTLGPKPTKSKQK